MGYARRGSDHPLTRVKDSVCINTYIHTHISIFAF